MFKFHEKHLHFQKDQWSLSMERNITVHLVRDSEVLKSSRRETVSSEDCLLVEARRHRPYGHAEKTAHQELCAAKLFFRSEQEAKIFPDECSLVESTISKIAPYKTFFNPREEKTSIGNDKHGLT